jgi:ATP-dependent DNA helicase RecG
VSTSASSSRDTAAILRGLHLSRAAVALFCQDDIQYPDFPQLKLRLARFKGSTRDEFLDNKQYSGNAFSLMRRAERFLLDWLPIAGRIEPGKLERIDTPALPIEAIREALANAIIHRDYTSGGGSVGVDT